jgi:hypothetical protein
MCIITFNKVSIMSTYTRLQSKPDTTIKLTGLLYHRERDVQVGDADPGVRVQGRPRCAGAARGAVLEVAVVTLLRSGC